MSGEHSDEFYALMEKVSRLEKEVEEYREERDDAQFALEEAEAEVERLRKQVKTLETEARMNAIVKEYDARMGEKRDKALDALRTGLMELMPLTFGIVPPEERPRTRKLYSDEEMTPEEKVKEKQRVALNAYYKRIEEAEKRDGMDAEADARAQAIAEEAEEEAEREVEKRKQEYLANYEPEWPDDRESTALWRARQG
jgi:hypothetical protein